MDITEIPMAVLQRDLAFCEDRMWLADTAIEHGRETRSDGESWRLIRSDAEGVAIKIKAEMARRSGRIA